VRTIWVSVRSGIRRVDPAGQHKDAENQSDNRYAADNPASVTVVIPTCPAIDGSVDFWIVLIGH
jgi:hypothetical protein